MVVGPGEIRTFGSGDLSISPNIDLYKVNDDTWSVIESHVHFDALGMGVIMAPAPRGMYFLGGLTTSYVAGT